MTRPQPTDHVKMMFLIQRKADASREELIAHWFANHMPEVIRRQNLQADRGKPSASRYLATVFDDGPGPQLRGVPREQGPALGALSFLTHGSFLSSAAKPPLQPWRCGQVCRL